MDNDYLLFGEPGSDDCREKLRRALSICAELGVPIAVQITEGLSTIIIFLGIELDTVAGVRLHRLQREIRRWSGRWACRKKELMSLIGQLQHACKVVRPGRSFVRHMIDLSTIAEELHHHIRLNISFCSDLQWWAIFLSEWNGEQVGPAPVGC